MFRRLVLATFLMVAAAPLSGQSKPDFSGTWSLESSFPRPSSPTYFAVAQSQSSITIDNQAYALDGSEVRLNESRTARVSWTGHALMITTTTQGPRGSWQDMDIYSLDYDGNLVVVRIRASSVPQSMNTSTAVFARVR